MMKIELYGNLADSDLEAPVRKLQSVYFFVNARQALALGDFLTQCAREMKGTPEWEHVHFALAWKSDIDIAVYNSDSRTVKQGQKKKTSRKNKRARTRTNRDTL